MTIQVSTWADLDEMKNQPTETFVLQNDLDQNTSDYGSYAGGSANSGFGWRPPGLDNGSGDSTTVFEGTLDGNGYAIRDFVIDASSYFQLGLIGKMNGGTVKDLTVSGCDITGDYNSGSVVGRGISNSTIDNVDVSNITMNINQYGGIAGVLEESEIRYSDITATLGITEDGAGGMVETLDTNSLCEDCTADITFTDASSSGSYPFGFGCGFALIDEATVRRVKVKGEIDFSEGSNAGIFSGNISYSTVEQCAAEGSIDISGGGTPDNYEFVGGFTGNSLDSSTNPGQVTVQECYADVDVTAGQSVGGFAGEFAGYIYDVYHRGSVTANFEIAGGVVGEYESDVEAARTYHVGDVTAPDRAGAIAGYLISGDFLDTYWDKDASTITENGTVTQNSYGTDPSTVSGTQEATKLTTAEMTGESAEDNMPEFDFDNVWVLTTSYPKLDIEVQSISPTESNFEGGETGRVYALVQYLAPDGSATGSATVTITNVDQGHMIHQDNSAATFNPGETRMYYLGNTAEQGTGGDGNLSGDRIDTEIDISASDASGRFALSFGNTLKGGHTHEQQFGVIEQSDELPKNCDVLVNGNSVGTSFGDGSNTFEQVVDLAEMLTPGQQNTIEVTSETNGHIQSHIDVDVYRQILGDG